MTPVAIGDTQGTLQARETFKTLKNRQGHLYESTPRRRPPRRETLQEGDPPRRKPPQKEEPPKKETPQEGGPPKKENPPRGRPTKKETPQEGEPPPRSRLRHKVNERPVLILLECILVICEYSLADLHC